MGNLFDCFQVWNPHGLPDGNAVRDMKILLLVRNELIIANIMGSNIVDD